MDEQELILRCQQGEAKLMDILVEMHEDSLYRFCYHLSGNADSAAELFQDTWIKAIHNIHKYKSSGCFLGWLFTITANLQRDRFRRLKRWQNILAKNQFQPPPGASIDERMLIHEQRVIVRQALAGMDDSLRIPIILVYFEKHSLDTAAEIIGIPVGTVKSRLHRAKKHLKKKLEVLL